MTADTEVQIEKWIHNAIILLPIRHTKWCAFVGNEIYYRFFYRIRKQSQMFLEAFANERLNCLKKSKILLSSQYEVIPFQVADGNVYIQGIDDAFGFNVIKDSQNRKFSFLMTFFHILVSKTKHIPNKR